MIFLRRGTLLLLMALCWCSSPAMSAEIDLVSRSGFGTIGNGPSSEPDINADGRFIAYVSDADNLVDHDPGSWYWNTDPDIFVLDRDSGLVENVSRDLNPNNYWFYQTVCKSPSLNARGDLAAFSCASGYHIKYRQLFRIFLYDRLSGSLGLITQGLSGRLVNGASDEVVISSDGSILAFTSRASNLISTDSDQSSDIYLYDIQNATLELASINVNGEKGNGPSKEATLSGNGQLIAYVSESDNLVDGDGNNAADIFYYDRQDGSVQRISSPGNTDCAEPSLSGDGSLLAFSASDGTGGQNLYLVARDGEPRFIAKGSSPALSLDGRFLAYVARTPGLPSDVKGILRLDLESGVHDLVSTTLPGTLNEGDSVAPAMTEHGSMLVFSSEDPHLVVGDNNASQDVFIAEAAVDTTPPEIHLGLSTQILWPPNKKFVEVLVGGSATDDSGSVEVEITLNDEYGSAIGQVVPGFGSSLWLEAWRDGNDTDGRTYTVTAVAVDAAGNRSEQSATVLVPHDMRNK